MGDAWRGWTWRWAVLAAPLIAIEAWLVAMGPGYGVARASLGALAALVLTGTLLALARSRVLGAVAVVLAWLLYVAALLASLLQALAWYFQGSGFSVRFFANVRLDNLKSGVHAFPLLAATVTVVVVVVLCVSAWLLAARGGLPRTASTRFGLPRIAGWVLLFVVALAVPSAWQRLGAFALHYRDVVALAGRLPAGESRLLADPDPVPRDAVRAAPGRNLVIIYMESLERIYTDNRIFPGLTPNLNRWRARGLDYAGYLTYTGADYTIAGLFASQCGAPYLPSPTKALELGGNNANATTFQPSLACLGDVLHAAATSRPS